MAYTSLTTYRQTPQVGSPNEYTSRTYSQSFQYIGAPPNAAVYQYLNPAINRLNNLRKCFAGRQHAIKLSASVIRYDDSGCATVHSETGVLCGEDAFD